MYLQSYCGRACRCRQE